MLRGHGKAVLLIKQARVEVRKAEKQRQISLSIVIPAYNEQGHIGAAIRSIDEYVSAKPWRCEVIVVDDGSNDHTAAEAKQAAKKATISVHVLRNHGNRGKGYSVRRGMLSAKGDFVLFSDADMSTPIQELDRLLPEARRGYDVVIGSRALKNSQIEVHQPLYRELMGKMFNLVLRTLELSHFPDTQCGFKLFSRRAVRMIFPLARINRFAFDVEILLIAQRLGLSIKQVPVHWRDSLPSKVSLYRDSSRMLFDVLKLRLTHGLGRKRSGRSAVQS